MRVPVKLLELLSTRDAAVTRLALSVREIVVDEAPGAVETVLDVKYAISIGYSFTGKVLKDGFCHIVVYKSHVNLGFNFGSALPDPHHVLEGTGKQVRHVRLTAPADLEGVRLAYMRRLLQEAIQRAPCAPA